MISSNTAVIYDIKKYAVHDGPGIRTTIFFKGCPLSCRWCHNPEGMQSGQQILYFPHRCISCGECIQVCPEGALHLTGQGVLTDGGRCRKCGACCRQCPALAREAVARYETVNSLVAVIEKDMAFYENSGGGVTFSGGEPLLQWQALEKLLRECRRKQIHTAVDTSGYAPWERIQGIAPFTDLFLYDLKMMDNRLHRRFTGVSNEGILSNLKKLARSGANIVVRIPLIPGINNTYEALSSAGRFIANLGTIPSVELLPYHDYQISKYERLGMTYGAASVLIPTPEALSRAAGILEALGVTVGIH